LKKILIIRFSSIGDIVLTTPVIRCIKKQLNAEVHYLTKKSFGAILDSNPYIDKLHLLEDSLTETIQQLRNENFDLVIDLHHNTRSFLVKKMLFTKSYSFNKLNFEKWLLVNFKINRLPAKHIVDRYLETCAPLGFQNDGEGLDYFITAKDEIDLNTLPSAFQNGYLAWVIGAKFATKRFPKEKIVEVLKNINQPVILLGGKEEEAMGIEICNKTSANVLNACGKYNLNQSASLVKQAKQVITNDTGLMHIAAAFKKEIISLWGNTIPEFGMYPYLEKSEVRNQIIETRNLDCRPCSKIGYDKCPKGHFDCMQKISTQEIWNAICS